jgi:hypothetical protein
MMDGISAMDTGNNGQMLNMNIESIAEVKVLTSGYQAEYGRSSGLLQITAVTKSGTNRFSGSVYDIEDNSDWNTNSWQNQKNGPEAGEQEPHVGLLDRRSGGPSRRRQQAVLLLQPRVPAVAGPVATSTASGCRRRSSARATSRSRSTIRATRFRSCAAR